MRATGGEDAHRQLADRLRGVLEPARVPVEDRAVQVSGTKTAPNAALDVHKVYGRETQPQPREESRRRAKGDCDLSVPGARFGKPQSLSLFFFAMVSGPI